VCHGAEVNKNDRWGGTPIRDAEAGGHRSVVEYLERNGAIRRPSRVEDESVPSPDDLVDMTGKLCDAARNGDVVKLRELLDAGAEVCRGDYVSGCVESNSGRPTPSTRRHPRSSICAMAWRFHAIDATLSP
jgi:hypothetical protein